MKNLFRGIVSSLVPAVRGRTCIRDKTISNIYWWKNWHFFHSRKDSPQERVSWVRTWNANSYESDFPRECFWEEGSGRCKIGKGGTLHRDVVSGLLSWGAVHQKHCSCQGRGVFCFVLFLLILMSVILGLLTFRECILVSGDSL